MHTASPSPSLRELMVKIEELPIQQMAEVADFVEFLRQRTPHKPATAQDPLNFPVISVGQWPEDLSLRREDLYGDDGR